MHALVREPEIKASVLNHLRLHGEIGRCSVLASEFRIPHGSVRVDLAVYADQFIGIEIKSEGDTLRRLRTQIKGYLNVFDRVIVVLAQKHMGRIDPDISAFVEIWEVDNEGSISTVSTPQCSFVQRDETAHIDSLSHFRKNFTFQSKEFWDEIGRRKIRPEHLSSLSRFYEKRQRVRRQEKMRVDFWQNWSERAAELFGTSS
jgi:hypothetical protein